VCSCRLKIAEAGHSIESTLHLFGTQSSDYQIKITKITKDNHAINKNTILVAPNGESIAYMSDFGYLTSIGSKKSQ
jgi:hypothetical protein